MSLKNVVLGIAILILTIFVVVYGIGTFYEKPEYSDFCAEFKTAEVIETEAQCVAIGGKWNSYEEVKTPEMTTTGYCDRDYECRQEYEDAMKKYYKNLFLMTLPIGIVIIVLGAMIFGLETVGAGLMGGGVGVILYGVGGYWRYSENLLKFILSLIGLAVVIWFSYFYNKRLGKKK